MGERLALRRKSWPHFYQSTPRHHWLFHWPTLLNEKGQPLMLKHGGTLPQKKRRSENRHHHSLIQVRPGSGKLYERSVWWWPDLSGNCREIVNVYVFNEG